MKTVKIYDAEYRELKALAKKQGYFVQYLVSQAVRDFLARKQREAQNGKESK